MGNAIPESAVAADHDVSATIGEAGASKAKATSTSSEAISAEISGGSVTTRVGLGGMKAEEAPNEEDADEQEAHEEGSSEDSTEPEQGGDEEPTAEEDLGDYDPTDEAKIEKFDAKYLREDGTLDVHGKLSTEFWANAEKGVDGLNEATYAYLRDRFGIDKDTVKDIEAAQKAKASAAKNEIHARFGGEEQFNAAMEWARKGGYTKAQRDRFNAASKSNDPAAIDEALTALEARWSKATGGAKKAEEPASRGAVKPKRDVTTAGTRPGVTPYASHEEWAAAFKAADKQNASVMAQIRRGLKASPWYKTGG